MEEKSSVTKMGSMDEGYIQRIFCINDSESMIRVSKEAKIVEKTPKTIRVKDKEVEGWIVDILNPGTDGVVRFEPEGEQGLSVGNPEDEGASGKSQDPPGGHPVGRS